VLVHYYSAACNVEHDVKRTWLPVTVRLLGTRFVSSWKMGAKAQQMESRSHRGSSLHLNPNSKCSKRRIRWTSELHQRFEQAVAALGGPANATPKGILERMKAPDVTIMHIKSHLQKYRLTLTADGSGQHKYSGSDEYLSFQEHPASSGRMGISGAQTDAPGDEEEFDVDHDAVGLELGDADNIKQLPTEDAVVQQNRGGTDNDARKKLVDTVVQQHTMQEELKHQIRVRIPND
jgi:SHAQKYF class myb-like DNA-binding protein